MEICGCVICHSVPCLFSSKGASPSRWFWAHCHNILFVLTLSSVCSWTAGSCCRAAERDAWPHYDLWSCCTLKPNRKNGIIHNTTNGIVGQYCTGFHWIKIVLTSLSFSGIDFKIKTIELRGKKIKLQIWWVRIVTILLEQPTSLCRSDPLLFIFYFCRWIGTAVWGINPP